MSSYAPPSSAPPVRPGEILAGKYRVEQVLGAGGMGLVVAATHLELEQRVAVKFLLGHIASTEAVARFVREARAAAKIKSEHVARVIDVGRLDDDSPYMVMEYLEGRDLAACLIGGPLPIDDAIDFVIQASDAMAEAHAEGIIHRDLKPANLFLTHRSDGSPLVKVLDFGISKLTTPEASDMNLTSTAAVMGSPMYMSPEQSRTSRTVDQRTDIWSLGVILFELLAGRPPFKGHTLPELITAIALDAPEPLRVLRPEIPLELEEAVLRCLRKDRDERFQTVGELVAALSGLAPRRSRPICERVLKVSGINESSLAVQTPRTVRSETPAEVRTGTAWSESHTPSARSLDRKWLLAAPVMFLLLGTGYFLSRSKSEPQSETPPPPSAQPAEQSLPTLPSAVPAAPPLAPSRPAPASTATALPPPSAAAAPTASPPPRARLASPLPPRTSAATEPKPPPPSVIPPPSAAPAQPATSSPAPPRRRGLDIDLK